MCGPTDPLECVRIDIIQPKRIPTMNAWNYLQLPPGLLGLRNLAGKTMMKRNRINRDYFNVLTTKYIYFDGKKTTSANTEVRKMWKWTQKFKDKTIDLDLDAERQEDQRGVPTTTTTVRSDGTSQTTTTYGDDVSGAEASFASVYDPYKMVWAVISFSTQNRTDPNWSMSMMRTNKWRDPHGVN